MAQRSLGSVVLTIALIAALPVASATGLVSPGSSAGETPEQRVQPQVNGSNVSASGSNVSASLTFTSQLSYGGSVIVDEANVSEGGFVVIRNETAGEEPIIGVSRYLAPGSYDDLRVPLFEAPGREFNESRLTGDQRVSAVLHSDTNGNQQFDFAEGEQTDTDNETDGPYSRNGSTVQNPTNVSVIGSAALAQAQPTAEVSFTSQAVTNGTVTVRSANLSAGGFVVAYRGEGTSGPIIGVSRYLGPGSYEDVRVELFNVSGGEYNETSLNGTQNLTASASLDTNNNSQFDFLTSNESEDVPYLRTGSPVTNPATVQVGGPGSGTNSTGTTMTANASAPGTASPSAPAADATNTARTTGGTGEQTMTGTATPRTAESATAGDGADSGGSPTAGGDSGGQTETTGPGFGLVAALVALLTFAGAMARRRG